MDPDRQNCVIAELMGWVNQGKAKNLPALNNRWVHPGTGEWRLGVPNYTGDYDLVIDAETKLLVSSKPYSSRPDDHEEVRFLYHLQKILGIEFREELVISFEGGKVPQMDWHKATKLPPNTVILSHGVPKNGWGYDLVIMRATAAQRAEALLRALNKWEE